MAFDATQGQTQPSDFGTDDGAKARRWLSEIDLAEKNRRQFIDRCKRIIEIYATKLKPASDTASDDGEWRRFPLLWANMETLEPAVFAHTPTAVVSRRWKDDDPVGRVASEVLERALNFQLDMCDFEGTFKGLTKDFLLLARGVPWVRYVPRIAQKDPEGGEEQQTPSGEISDGQEPYEVLEWEEAIPDHISYDDFLHNQARKWSEVRWVGRISYLTRDECKTRFGDELGQKIPLDHKVDGENKEQWDKAAIYEIWDKVSRKAIWVSKSWANSLLDERDDPLKLPNFFPCPKPATGTTGPDSLLPIADYEYYRSQAADINELTRRIGILMEALKVLGFYAAGGEQKDKLQDLMSMKTGTIIPIDSWASLMDKGGLDKIISWFPVETIALTLKASIEARQQLLEDVQQITGMADIMRGDVDPDETATATNAKTNWGSSRIRKKQQELARVARETVQIMGEIIATKFDPKTLSAMTNVKLFETVAQKQQVQQQIAAAQQPPMQGQPPAPPPQIPPQLQQMLDQPTWEEVCGLLRDGTMRAFRLDIETDSTIEPDDQEEKQRSIEFVEAIGKLLGELIPMLQVAPQLLPIGAEAVKYLTRKFRVGREMEDTIDKAMDSLQQAAAQGQGQAPPKPGPDPQAERTKAQASMIGAQAKMSDAQTNQFRAQTDRAEAQAGASLEQQRIQHEAGQNQMDRSVDLHTQAEDRKAEFIQSIVKAVERHSAHEMVNPQPIKAPTP